MLPPGAHLGPYEILSLIGSGGMGRVYRARDPRLNRDVAIKVADERFAGRSALEAQAIAGLNHPNICTVHDVGPNYLVMELLEGQTLAERIAQGPMPPAAALDVACQIASAIEEAHGKGVLHRDLKPSNVMLGRRRGSSDSPNVKVLDFGLCCPRPPRRITALGNHGERLAAERFVSAIGQVVTVTLAGRPREHRRLQAARINCVRNFNHY